MEYASQSAYAGVMVETTAQNYHKKHKSYILFLLALCYNDAEMVGVSSGVILLVQLVAMGELYSSYNEFLFLGRENLGEWFMKNTCLLRFNGT